MTNAAEANLLSLLFLNTNWASLGDSTGLRGSTASGNLCISLHTADPGEAAASGQSTSETGYTGYTRVNVARSAGGFTLAAPTISNAGLVQFPQCSGGSSTITHFGIGTDFSGSGNLIFKGALTSSLSVSTGIQPQFAAGALTVTVD